MDNWNRTLAKEIAKGIVKTGIEGPFDTVVKSTAYDYPSIGCSCWEGNRANELLRAIPGGEEFVGRTYIADAERAFEKRRRTAGAVRTVVT